MTKNISNIKEKLSKINKYWNSYYYSKKFFQNKINFTDDVKTNYYGDLNTYFHDTLPLIKSFNNINTAEQYISNTIVLLQTIYVHQDLIDELLYIFKIDKSLINDKNPNREIRNELIGHPISRDKKNKNILKSSILLDINNLDYQTISYHKYSKDNKFKPQKQTYNIDNIISRHIEFIDKYLTEIIKKCEKEIDQYNRKIKEIFTIPLEKQFNFIEQIDPELLLGIDIIFKKEYLEFYYKNIRKHRRYLYCLKNYKKTVQGIVFNKDYSPITFESTSSKRIIDDNYAIEKLYAKHPLFNIDLFIKTYKDNPIIHNELLYMKKNIDDDKEYYASLNYLTYVPKEST